MKDTEAAAKFIGQLVPIVGSWIENKFSKDGGEGNTQIGKLLRSLWRVAATAAITYWTMG